MAFSFLLGRVSSPTAFRFPSLPTVLKPGRCQVWRSRAPESSRGVVLMFRVVKKDKQDQQVRRWVELSMEGVNGGKARAGGAVCKRLLREYLSQRRCWSSTLAPSHFNLGAIVTSACAYRHPSNPHLHSWCLPWTSRYACILPFTKPAWLHSPTVQAFLSA
jgi:hypothetical protein